MSTIGSFWGRKKQALLEDAGAFTDHVRLLIGGRPLDEGSLAPLWSALRAALRAELRRRGLWESPPAFVGIYGWDSWETPGEMRQGALEELLFECYTYIFVQRLRGLEAQLKVKPNVDGLIFLNIRHFLHERQKEHDPLGSQVFEVLRSAVRMAVEEGALRVVSGDEGVRNDTVLSFSPEAQSPVAREAVAALVPSWNDDLLPDLVTLRGQRQEEVVRRLRDLLPGLRREGVAAFRFKDLVDPLKADVRKRWAAILDESQGEAVPQGGEEERSRVRVVAPDQRVEERQLFRWLVDCVLTAVRRLDTSERTREYLVTLWQFVRLQASEGPAAPGSRLGQLLQETGDEEHPSLRRQAEQLRIPRERLPGLYETLGSLLERCRAANSGRIAVTSG